MKAIIVFCCLWAVTLAGKNECYETLLYFCEGMGGVPRECNATYGDVSEVRKELSLYVNTHVAKSFDYLQLATGFGGFVKDRKGFEKLFRHLSDRTWEDGIDLIKYITKRGGTVDFKRKWNDNDTAKYMKNLNELSSLSLALDFERNLAEQAYSIIKKSNDPALANYLKNKFITKKADNIRFLSGSIHSLHVMTMDSWQRSISLYIFDDYLNKGSLLI